MLKIGHFYGVLNQPHPSGRKQYTDCVQLLSTHGSVSGMEWRRMGSLPSQVCHTDDVNKARIAKPHITFDGPSKES